MLHAAVLLVTAFTVPTLNTTTVISITNPTAGSTVNRSGGMFPVTGSYANVPNGSTIVAEVLDANGKIIGAGMITNQGGTNTFLINVASQPGTGCTVRVTVIGTTANASEANITIN